MRVISRSAFVDMLDGSKRCTWCNIGSNAWKSCYKKVVWHEKKLYWSDNLNLFSFWQYHIFIERSCWSSVLLLHCYHARMIQTGHSYTNDSTLYARLRIFFSRLFHSQPASRSRTCQHLYIMFDSGQDPTRSMILDGVKFWKFCVWVYNYEQPNILSYQFFIATRFRHDNTCVNWNRYTLFLDDLAICCHSITSFAQISCHSNDLENWILTRHALKEMLVFEKEHQHSHRYCVIKLESEQKVSSTI